MFNNVPSDRTRDHKIYLLQTSFVERQPPNRTVYKIGRSYQSGMKRVAQYPPEFQIVLVRTCNDSNEMETQILKLFNRKYERAMGFEYFYGEFQDMIKDINIILDQEAERHNSHKNYGSSLIKQNDSIDSDEKSFENPPCKKTCIESTSFVDTPVIPVTVIVDEVLTTNGIVNIPTPQFGVGVWNRYLYAAMNLTEKQIVDRKKEQRRLSNAIYYAKKKGVLKP